jgi:hypothetical protein
MLLMLPFGGAVLNQIGVSTPEVDAILEEVRKEYMMEEEDDERDGNQAIFKFADLFRRKSVDNNHLVDQPESEMMNGDHSLIDHEIRELESIVSSEGEGMMGGLDMDQTITIQAAAFDNSTISALDKNDSVWPTNELHQPIDIGLSDPIDVTS